MKRIVATFRGLWHELKESILFFKNSAEYDCYKWEFIWGAKTDIYLPHKPMYLHEENDIEIFYSATEKRYFLNIETAFYFVEKEQEAEYLTSLLDVFTEYMNTNNIPINVPYRFWMSQPSILFEAETISEIYTGFRLFVEGYKAIYGNTSK